jgi:hypothetical protein
MLTQLRKEDAKQRQSVNPMPTTGPATQMKHTSQLQEAANNSPQVQQLVQLQKGASSKNAAPLTASTGGQTQASNKDKKAVEPKHNSDEFKGKSKKKKIKAAMNSAYRMISKAKGHVDKDHPKYKRWMDAGKADIGNRDKRVEHVKDGVNKIEEVLREEEITLRKYGLADGEEEETFAYVYPDEVAHNIYLGGAFWDANTSGYNSKAGTIIHELSHRVHSTEDHVYGMKDAKALAKDDPQLAVTNADNYEFLAEGA